MVSTIRRKKGSTGLGRVLAELDRSTSILLGVAAPPSLAPRKEDDSSNRSLTSTTSSSSSESSSKSSSTRRVKFYPKVTVYPSREKIITVEDRICRWITKYDLDAIKDEIRSTTSQVLDHRDLRVAVDRLHGLIRKKNFYVVADVDGEQKYAHEQAEEETSSTNHQLYGMNEVDLARILIDSDIRGVERMIFTRLDQYNGMLRPVTRHSMVVMQTQASVRHLTLDQQEAAIARRCETGASSKWAHTLARADAEAVSRHFMLQF